MKKDGISAGVNAKFSHGEKKMRIIRKQTKGGKGIIEAVGGAHHHVYLWLVGQPHRFFRRDRICGWDWWIIQPRVMVTGPGVRSVQLISKIGFSPAWFLPSTKWGLQESH